MSCRANLIPAPRLTLLPALLCCSSTCLRTQPALGSITSSYGCVNEHNGWIPRDFWLERWEKEAIIGFYLKNPLEGYRRLTFMMLDADVVAVSPASVWRVLQQAGMLSPEIPDIIWDTVQGALTDEDTGIIWIV